MLVGITALIFSTSCENNKKEVLYRCDSTNVSYSKSVEPILKTNCYRCHSTANSGSGGGTILDNYAALFTNNFVDTTAIDGGTLLNDVKHIGNPMPKSGKLSDCDISKIEHWIKEGAKNN